MNVAAAWSRVFFISVFSFSFRYLLWGFFPFISVNPVLYWFCPFITFHVAHIGNKVVKCMVFPACHQAFIIYFESTQSNKGKSSFPPLKFNPPDFSLPAVIPLFTIILVSCFFYKYFSLNHMTSLCTHNWWFFDNHLQSIFNEGDAVL